MCDYIDMPDIADDDLTTLSDDKAECEYDYKDSCRAWELSLASWLEVFRYYLYSYIMLISYSYTKMLVMLMMIAMASSAKIPSSEFFSSLRSISGQVMGREWGFSLRNKEDGGAWKQILRSSENSPSVQFLLKDNLFLNRLQLFIDQPNDHHFHQLRNRARTLRRRRTQQISAHFFLRNWAFDVFLSSCIICTWVD